MVQAFIKISNETNQILNIVKARFGLKDKSQAIEAIAAEYGQILLEPALRPEFIERSRKIRKNKKINVRTVKNLKKRLGV